MTPTPAQDPLEPSEGWGVVHLFLRTAHGGDASGILDAVARFTAVDPQQVVAFSVLGGRADLGLMALGPDLDALDAFTKDVLAGPVEHVYSFFSLTELNAAIRELLVRLNERPFKKLPGCRRTCFEQLDRPAMKPLPPGRYTYAEWKRARVHIDYHVQVLGHYYSAPYQLVRQEVDVRISAHTVELLLRGKRVASHRRSPLKGRHTTLAEHMPQAHRHYAEWTPQRLVRWAEASGPATAEVVATILGSRAHPQQGFRSCLGIMRLGTSYGAARLEAACRRALHLGATTYTSLRSMLEKGLDQQPLPPIAAESGEPIAHGNIRGPEYYH